MLHDQRKDKKEAVVFPVSQKEENLQQPEYTAPHWIINTTTGG